jgi:hypothetical protein
VLAVPPGQEKGGEMKPNLKRAFLATSPSIEKAARRASKGFRDLSIRHALIGGLAVGAYGYLRATKDVDFLVGEEGFDRHGDLVTLRGPFMVGEIPVDHLRTVEDAILEAAVDKAEESEGIPVVPLHALVLLKLRAGRRQDFLDLVKLHEVVPPRQWRDVVSFLENDYPELLEELLIELETE